MKPLAVGIVGCGAVAELFHAPALRALERNGRIKVTTLTDPNETRREKLAEIFPAARRRADLPGAGDVQLVLLASPVRWHAEQAVALLSEGIGVLCEKPVATTSAAAETMVAAAQRRGAVLAVGLVRRFFPALNAIADFCAGGAFGAVRSFNIEEGGPFNWPAATPSFFDAKQAGGGVLLDTGVHVLDALGWWFGDAAEIAYSDDAEGGLEANCRIALAHGRGERAVKGSVRLSRDWKTSNVWTIEFERATVRWRVGEADRVEIRPANSAHWLVSQVAHDASSGTTPADSYLQCFTRQFLDVVEAVEKRRAPRVSGEAAIGSLRLIERCYAARAPSSLEVAR